MPGTLPRIEKLPQRTATQVKNKWSDVVRAVRTSGSVAVTQHDRIEMVVMDVETYRKMTALAEDDRGQHRAVLSELSAEFDHRLASLQHPDTHVRVQRVMAARGRTKRRPKAGTSF